MTTISCRSCGRLRRFEHLYRCQDGHQRRAELMGEHREKTILGLLGIATRLSELCFCAAFARDIPGDAEEANNIAIDEDGGTGDKQID